jgi:RsiW-degrading membrane proteinase PrsW (M82 family)
MVNWFSVALGLLPAIIWMAFFLQEDKKRPEPKRLIISTFLLGGAIAFVTLQFQTVFSDISTSIGVRAYSPFSIFWLAGIEEFFKFLVVFLWVSKRKDFDEPIDAMIYMIIAALGFATVENIASVARATNGFELVTLRFLGATFLHTLSSGLLGYYWAIGLLRKTVTSFLAAGWFVATLLHSIFNALILIYGPVFQVTIFLVFVAFFVLSDFEKLKRISPTLA